MPPNPSNIGIDLGELPADPANTLRLAPSRKQETKKQALDRQLTSQRSCIVLPVPKIKFRPMTTPLPKFLFLLFPVMSLVLRLLFSFGLWPWMVESFPNNFFCSVIGREIIDIVSLTPFEASNKHVPGNTMTNLSAAVCLPRV